MATSVDDQKLIKELSDAKYNVSTERLDMSFGEITSMFERKDLIIDPEFQRLFRWSLEQQTSFIESILLGIPIPSIFVAEDENGKWELVDGLQRLSTIFSFFGVLKSLPDKNHWALLKGDFLPTLKDYTVDTLPLKINLNIRNRPIRVEIIQYNEKMDMRYELFKRLNTGGSPLKDQEIRNAIFRGISTEFNNILIRLAKNEQFISLISPTQKQIEEKYIEELVLRFTALHYGWQNVDESLSLYLTEFMREEVQNHKIDYTELEILFNRVMAVLTPQSRDVFRSENGVFSSSLFDGITIGVAENIDYFEQTPKVLETCIRELKGSQDFKKYTGAAANSKRRVKGRVEISLRIFSSRD